MISTDDLSTRKVALEEAQKFVEPILEKYPLETVENRPHPAPVFTAQARFTETPATQALDHILRVADWLLEENT